MGKKKYKDNQNSGGGGGNDWGSGGGGGQKQQQGFQNVIFISNYLPQLNIHNLIQFLSIGLQTDRKQPLKVKDVKSVAGGFAITVINPQQANDAVSTLNGKMLGGRPLWVVHFPGHLGDLCPGLRAVFGRCYLDGKMDLSRLAQKIIAHGLDATPVNFNNLFFVEFLFFQLGSDSRDMWLPVTALNLSSNMINSIDKWSPFFFFMPYLQFLVLDDNNFSSPPRLPNWPALKIQCQKGGGGKPQDWGQQPQQQQQQQQQQSSDWGNPTSNSGWGNSNSNDWGNSNTNTGWENSNASSPWGNSNSNDWGNSNSNSGWGNSNSNDWGNSNSNAGWGNSNSNDWGNSNTDSGWGGQNSTVNDWGNSNSNDWGNSNSNDWGNSNSNDWTIGGMSSALPPAPFGEPSSGIPIDYSQPGIQQVLNDTANAPEVIPIPLD